MKIFGFLCVLLVSVSGFTDVNDVYKEEWETFKTRYNKEYSSPIEDGLRMMMYLKSKVQVANHNQRYYEGKETFLMENNMFSDMLPDETKKYNGYVPFGSSEVNETAATFLSPHDDVILPDSVDWRKEGAVTPVKNQGFCGSCWAFAATGSLEGLHFRKTGKLVSLSEQNLLDCVKDSKNRSETCRWGGTAEDAFHYIKMNHGIDTEESYPYEGRDGICRFNKNNVGATDKGFVRFVSEKALKEAVALVGPVTVGIHGSSETFQKYSSGYYYDRKCDPHNLDHAVLVVGYGTTYQGLNYWIIKNSWGKNWGRDGYMLMIRGLNTCGIANEAVFPIV